MITEEELNHIGGLSEGSLVKITVPPGYIFEGIVKNVRTGNPDSGIYRNVGADILLSFVGNTNPTYAAGDLIPYHLGTGLVLEVLERSRVISKSAANSLASGSVVKVGDNTITLLRSPLGVVKWDHQNTYENGFHYCWGSELPDEVYLIKEER